MSDEKPMNAAVSQAVDWLVLLSSGRATQDDMRALEAWRQASPENESSFRLLVGVKPVGEAMLRQPAISRRAILTGGVTACAGITAFALARPPLGLWPSFAELLADHRTGPGQRLALRPGNGVTVELNSRTSIARLGNKDGFRLIEGEAFIEVARGIPFDLQAREARISASNASFNLETIAGGVRVGCLSGTVQCDLASKRASLATGDEWRMSADGDSSVRTVDAANLARWRTGSLSFDRAPLSDVVEQFNRYRATPIVLANEAIGTRQVSGHFLTHNTTAAVFQLQRLLELNVRRLPGDIILIS